MSAEEILPQNATRIEVALAEALDYHPVMGPGISGLRSFKFVTPNESVLPWLIVEYGLGPVTPYLPTMQAVILAGLRWTKVKGTPRAVAEALSWIGYSYDELYEAPTRRARWHLYELDIGRFWDAETPDLDRIEAVVRLSQPVRSEFWRGFEYHNVRGVDWDHSVVDDSLWDDDSGVRLHAGGVKWSFGRPHEPVAGTYDLTEAELTALGLWIAPTGSALAWGAFPWSSDDVTWSDSAITTRAALISAGLITMSCWVGLYRANGSVIGFRRAKALHTVTPVLNGPYRVGANTYAVSPAGPRVYAEALTDFGQGDGQVAASWAFIFDGELPSGAPPGTQWLAGNTLVGGVKVGNFPITPAEAFGKTSREQFRAVLQIV